MVWLTSLLAILELLVKIEPYAVSAVTDVFEIIDIWKTTGVAPTQAKLESLQAEAHNARLEFDSKGVKK